jgi:hypothetical protein
MQINEQGRIIPSEQDTWALLIRWVTDQRVVSVGPYAGLAGFRRAQQDKETWENDPDVRTLLVRMMPPACFEDAYAVGGDAFFGYSANMRHRRTNTYRNPFMTSEER